jgi:hypothetical protein
MFYGRPKNTCAHCVHALSVESRITYDLMRSEVFTTVNIQVEIFRIVTPYSVFSVFTVKMEVARFSRNDGFMSQHYTASQARAPRFKVTNFFQITIPQSYLVHLCYYSYLITGNFSLHHRLQNGSGVHPASYPLGTGASFPGGKAAGTSS